MKKIWDLAAHQELISTEIPRGKLGLRNQDQLGLKRLHVEERLVMLLSSAPWMLSEIPSAPSSETVSATGND